MQMTRALVGAAICLLAGGLLAQDAPLDGQGGRQLLLENFRPRQALKVAQHELTRAKFPVIDVHTHFREKFRGSADELDAWVKLMDRNRVAVCVSLDGLAGELIDEHAKQLRTKPQDRVALFANLDRRGHGTL